MAFWGAPFSDPERHAELACMSALRQMELLKSFRSEIPEILGVAVDFADVFNIRIGLATGEVVLGSVGSEHSQGYTVMR